MSDRFETISMDELTRWIFGELEERGSIFGIPKRLFFAPSASDPFVREVYGKRLETPFGVAAGPHSQLAHNIVVAWLCGARFIELKTVQTLDELEIAKPCIDMQDEGYNIEWSQELKVDQSLEEYVRAWVLIHALHGKLGFSAGAPGVIFNVSVGYDLKGIREPNVQRFLAGMNDASDLVAAAVETVARHYPAVADLSIPTQISDNITLSTMHGCPPDEIESIARYLLEERRVHTSVKLNPTLLGPDKVRSVLGETLGFDEVVVPDEAFGHDLKYPDAVGMIERLGARASELELAFGVKLSNTLEVQNHRRVFSKDERMMYLSGRPLHALTVHLAQKLARQFDGKLAMSFAGGAEAFNAPHLLRCGMTTVTTCTDLLKPGGYLRLLQYIDETRSAMAAVGADDLDRFVMASAGDRSWPTQVVAGAHHETTVPAAAAAKDLRAATLANLGRYAAFTLSDRTLRKETFDRSLNKTARALGAFDCIEAPCTDECPTHQHVPEYMRRVGVDDLEGAATITRLDNPMAAILGRACHHPCEKLCVRTHYDEPLAIREVKRFIMDHERAPERRQQRAAGKAPVAVIGAGPCGLSAAYYLSQGGYPVTVFEAEDQGGGMVSATIPTYRASQRVIDQDLELIASYGADIRYGQKAGRDFTLPQLREQGVAEVVVAAGAQRGIGLGIAGEDGPGVLDGLAFLRAARRGPFPRLGERVGVIGGGDVAMDCARSARRLGCKVTILYRRTVKEMPAQREELDAAREEGIELVELVAPRSLVRDGEALKALRCARMRLGEPDASGRRRPIEIEGSEHDIPLDALIMAIGQQADLDFFAGEPVTLNAKGYIDVDPETMLTSLDNVYAGGDVAAQGPATIVRALADGRRIAAAIQAQTEPAREHEPPIDRQELLAKRTRRKFRVLVPERPAGQREGFDEVVATLTREQAVEEAGRCLDCDRMCSLCVSVCPNLAFMTYETERLDARLPTLTVKGAALEPGAERRFTVSQSLQVAVLTDFCNECGNCNTFCPTAGTPYRDKPRLYRNAAAFEAEKNNAYAIERRGERWAMRAKMDGDTHEIELDEAGRIHYQSPALKAVLQGDTLEIVSSELTNGATEGASLSLEPCATMYVLLEGVRRSLPQLPVATR